MKKLMVAMMLLVSMQTMAQDFDGKRIIAREQLIVRGTRVDSLLLDTAGWLGRIKSIPVADAIEKKLRAIKTSPGGVTGNVQINNGGNFFGSNALNFDGNMLTIENGAGAKSVRLGNLAGLVNNPALYFGNSSMSVYNYNLAGDENYTAVNASTNLYNRIANNDVLSMVLGQATLYTPTSAGYGSKGFKISDTYNGGSVVLQTLAGTNFLYITDPSGNPSFISSAGLANPNDGTQLQANSGDWTFTGGKIRFYNGLMSIDNAEYGQAVLRSNGNMWLEPSNGTTILASTAANASPNIQMTTSAFDQTNPFGGVLWSFDFTINPNLAGKPLVIGTSGYSTFNGGDIILRPGLNQGTFVQSASRVFGIRMETMGEAQTYVNNTLQVDGGLRLKKTVSSAGTLSLVKTSYAYVFTGTTTTWTLQAGIDGLAFEIKNRGTGAITLNRTGSDVIFTSASVTSITINPGDNMKLVYDAGTATWDVFQ